MSSLRSGLAACKKRSLVAVVIGAMVTLTPLVFSATASAEFGIVPGTFEALARDDGGSDLSQAGAHPNATTAFELRTTTTEMGNVVPDEDLKDVRVELPVGLVGDPGASPRCERNLFNSPGTILCPTETQIGVATIDVRTSAGGQYYSLLIPVFNLVSTEDRPAEFGFRLLRNNVVISADVRTGSDYGVTATIKDLPGGVILYKTELTLWGVPAARTHDAQRFLPGVQAGMPPGDENGDPIEVSTTPRAFFFNPTQCTDTAPVTKIAIRSWQHPERWVTDEAVASSPVTNCDKLRFDPSVSLAPRAPRAFAPSGYEVELGFRQQEDPVGLAPSALKDAIVTLPAGTVVNPSSADGLQACSPEQIALTSAGPPACPGASKVGTVEIETPLLTRNLTGAVYLARQTPTQLLSLYLTAEGSGVVVKLAGTVDPDPVTGQLRATFRNNPQLPVRRITLSFKEGPRAPLSNPRTCGAATTTAVLSPWSGMLAATPTSSFTISGDGFGSPCPAHRFAPSFVAGTQNPAAGAYSPLSVTFGRDDVDEYMSGIAMSMPKGLLARISSATLCSDAQAAAGTCGEDSRIGSVTTEAGAGSLPLQLPGRVYITGPYEQAPFGLSIVVPAVAGPFDLGTVVVRAKIEVDRHTAALRIVSDPLPTILEGIPLQIRLVDVRVDRKDFTLNPTNCSASKVEGELTSTAGDRAPVSSRFQVGNCKELPFTPRMTLKAGSRGRTASGQTTPLTVTLAMRQGQANNRRVQVTLPRAFNSRIAVVSNRNACTQAQFAASRCPTRVGTATAVTPLLRDPLRGDIYMLRNPARRLPDMAVALKGQVDFDLIGKITITRDLAIRTDFDTVPDVPISKFTLRLVPGRNGAVGIVDNLCSTRTRRTLSARLVFNAQNGARVSRNQRMQVAGCGTSSGGRRSTTPARRAGKRRSARAQR